jgi:hypothetical protein
VIAPGQELLPEPATHSGTGWFVYGVTRPTLALPADLIGVDDQPVRLLPHGRVAAVVSAALLERPPGRRAEIFAYTRVLDALAVPGPVAPVRFGSIFADTDDVVDHLLAPDGDDLQALLEDLTDRVQLRLVALWREGTALREVVAGDAEIARLREHTRDLPEDAGYPERVRLGQLVAAQVDELRAEATASILEAVAPFCVAVAETAGSGPERIFEAHLLVDVSRWPDLEEMLESLAAEVHERIRLQFVGPMAPYDFVGGGRWD